MKATPLIIGLFLTSTAYGFSVEGESAFYLVNLKKDYQRELGYNNWKGKKRGALYKLEIGDKLKIKKGSEFKFSVITNTTKSEYLNVFTSKGERFFSSNPKLFTVKELYLLKKHFIFKNLTLKVGKQRFNLSPLINDHLWGGHFEYKVGKFQIVWNQIAGYEGNYFLFKGKSEDDIDIFNLNLKREGNLLGFYLISDARGNEKAVKKVGILGRIRWKKFRFEGATQNGKRALLASKEGRVSIQVGYSQKGFTSYGFKEGIRDIGLIFKPSFSNLKFVKLKYRLNKNLTLFALQVRKGKGTIGSEIGGEVNYQLGKLYDIFLKGSLGSGGSYALFGGLRFSTERPKIVSYLKGNGIKVRNYFNVVGEYADLPKVDYSAQAEYEDWSRAKHVGFWHSTYRLQVKEKGFKLQVATGPNNKWDFLVWGNTRDNFIYKPKSRKEWHLEEAYVSRGKVKVGLMEVIGEGLFNDSFSGVSFKGKHLKVFLISRKEEKSRKYGLLKLDFKKGGIYAFKGAGSPTFGVYWALNLARIGFLKQKGNWGAFLKARKETFGTQLSVEYKVYSKDFKTYSLREFSRNEGFIFRPGEKDVRVLKLKLKRNLTFKRKKLARIKPSLSLYYLKLKSFSGRYIGEEGGIIVSVKPGKKCTLDLIGGVGSRSSYYEGIYFSVKW